MKKKNEIMNIIDELIELLAHDGKTMNIEDWNQNIGQLQAYITVLGINSSNYKDYAYTMDGLANNKNYWNRQRKQIKEKAEELNYFTKTVEELKAELKKAEEDEQEAYRIGGQNQSKVIDAMDRQYAAKYTLNNI